MMQKIVFAVFVAVLLSDDTISAFNLPKVGNCSMRCNVPLVPLTMEDFEAYRPWEMLYVTNIQSYEDIDGLERDGVRLRKGLYNVTDTFIRKDKSVGKFRLEGSVVDNIVVEKYTINGTTHIRYLYPIAVTFDHGLLFHHCDADGRADVDMRSIWSPHNVTISDENLKYLMEADKMCNFRGELRKLSDAV